MAVLRAPGPRRFRHFGSPEQRREQGVRSGQEGSMNVKSVGEHEGHDHSEMSPAELAAHLGIRPRLSLSAFVFNLFKQWVMMVLTGWVINIVAAGVTAPLIWWSWNHGVVPAVGVSTLPLLAAFAFALFVTSVAGLFRSQVTVNAREE